jgi:hypothetical protein
MKDCVGMKTYFISKESHSADNPMTAAHKELSNKNLFSLFWHSLFHETLRWHEILPV